MIDLEQLDQPAIEILKKSGWFAERFIEDFQYPSDFTCPLFVKTLLENIYALVIETEPQISSDNNTKRCFYGNLEFFPEDSFGENENENGTFAYFSKIMGCNFYPLGEITNTFFYIAIDDQQCLFLLGDNIVKLGDSFNQGFNMLLMGIKGKMLNMTNLEWEDN